jgi:Carboxypeptidase regulatory-like domain
MSLIEAPHPAVGLARVRLPKILISALCVLCIPALAHADTISGTIKDPSGALVPAARVEIKGESWPQPVVTTSDQSGKFSATNLTPGNYSVRVVKDGFDELVTAVELRGSMELSLSLTLAAQQTLVDVTATSSGYANSDSFYRQLRDVSLGDTYRCENFSLSMDAGTFVLKSGTITFLRPVNQRVTGAVFVGEGHFTLKAVVALDEHELARRSGAPTAEEVLSWAVFRFTGGEYREFAELLKTKAITPSEAATIFQGWKNKVRHRHDVSAGLSQALLESDTMDNVDPDLLASIYNPKHPPFFNAYMHGSPHKDLRFFVRARVGAIPQVDSPEEVALINCDEGGMSDGVWYSQHFLTELRNHTANSREDRRFFATQHYTIETDIAKNDRLYGRATITFVPLIAGERVMKFGLLPTLRVTRVTDQDRHDLHYVQEGKKEDGSFYAILDQAPDVGKEDSITIEYVGDKVVTDAGDGSYYVGARESPRVSY